MLHAARRRHVTPTFAEARWASAVDAARLCVRPARGGGARLLSVRPRHPGQRQLRQSACGADADARRAGSRSVLATRVSQAAALGPVEDRLRAVGRALLSLVPRHSRRPGPAAHRVVRASGATEDRARRGARAALARRADRRAHVRPDGSRSLPDQRLPHDGGVLCRRGDAGSSGTIALVLGPSGHRALRRIGAHRRVRGPRLGDLCVCLCARRPGRSRGEPCWR